MKPILTFILSLTFLFLFSGFVYGDDLQEGWNAYKNNDYKKAYKLWLPLTELLNKNRKVSESKNVSGVFIWLFYFF